MSKFKLRDKVTIDGSRFIDRKPRQAVISGVHSKLDTGLFTLGLKHFVDTAIPHTTYLVTHESPAFGNQIRLVSDDRYTEEDLVRGWK